MREDVKDESDNQSKNGDWEDEDRDRFPVFMRVMGVYSREPEALNKLPALVVLVCNCDSVAHATFEKVGNCDKGTISCDGVVWREPRPSSWPCIAASKTVYTSCSVVDRLIWHQVEDEQAEGMFIAQLACRESVCGSSEVTVAVFACGQRTTVSNTLNDKIGNKLAAWGVHVMVVKGDRMVGFTEYIPFVERTLRLEPMAYLQSRHFTDGGSVVWILGKSEYGQVLWFMHDNVKCKKWQTGTIARCGARDKERSQRATEQRWYNQQQRMQRSAWQWVKPCRRADPLRSAVSVDDDKP